MSTYTMKVESSANSGCFQITYVTRCKILVYACMHVGGDNFGIATNALVNRVISPDRYVCADGQTLEAAVALLKKEGIIYDHP